MRNQVSNDNTNGEEAISHLIGTLKRIEAPKDFDFHVKARIAKGKPTEKAVAWFPSWAGYAVPLGLVLAVGGYFGLEAVSSNNAPNAPVIAQEKFTDSSPSVVKSQMPDSQIKQDAIQVPESRVPEVKPDSGLSGTTAKTLIPEQVKKVVNKKEAPKIESFDIASNANLKILRPIGPGTNANSEGNSNSANAGTVRPPTDLLGSLGVRTTGGKVISVAPNSAGERSGIRAGDVIESVGAKNIRVHRDGKSVDISINH